MSGEGGASLQGLRIGLAGPADAAEIADLYLAARAAALPYLRRVHSDEDTRAWIAGVMLRRGTTWAAREGGAILGFLHLLDDHVDQLYLRPDAWRRGIGSRLLDMAKAARPGGLSLYCFQRNARARAFYERHGFSPAAFGDGSGNEEGEPDVLYRWAGA